MSETIYQEMIEQAIKQGLFLFDSPCPMKQKDYTREASTDDLIGELEQQMDLDLVEYEIYSDGTYFSICCCMVNKDKESIDDFKEERFKSKDMQGCLLQAVMYLKHQVTWKDNKWVT